MLSLQVPPSVDTPGWVADAIKFAAIFFFIGLPILRAIRESLQKRAQSEGAGKPRDVDERARDGRQAWEELMRGEPVESAGAEPSAQALPLPTPSMPAGTNVESRTAPSPAPARGLAEDFSGTKMFTSDTSEADAPDEEEVAARELDKRAGESLEQEIDRSLPRVDLGPAFERPSGPLRGVDRSKSLDSRGDQDKDRETAAPVKPVIGRAVRSKWRRAIVMNEVLSGPVSERDPSDRSRPAALRP